VEALSAVDDPVADDVGPAEVAVQGSPQRGRVDLGTRRGQLLVRKRAVAVAQQRQLDAAGAGVDNEDVQTQISAGTDGRSCAASSALICAWSRAESLRAASRASSLLAEPSYPTPITPNRCDVGAYPSGATATAHGAPLRAWLG
jgi:hypothetical protein